MPIIQSVERALCILNLFDEHSPELKITEISNHMNLHKSTVHSLLKTLQKHYYIEQDTESKKYRLGLKLFERGNFIDHSLDIKPAAKKHLHDLSIKTGYTVHLVILDGKEGVYIDKVVGALSAFLYSRIGKRVPAHCSGVGKVLLAYKGSQELKQILNNYIYHKKTENTLTSKKELLKELESVREKGYAIDNEENEHGVFCLAVPIRNHLRHVIASISISLPATGLSGGEVDKVIPLLKQTGDNISKELGFNHQVFEWL